MITLSCFQCGIDSFRTWNCRILQITHSRVFVGTFRISDVLAKDNVIQCDLLTWFQDLHLLVTNIIRTVKGKGEVVVFVNRLSYSAFRRKKNCRSYKTLFSTLNNNCNIWLPCWSRFFHCSQAQDLQKVVLHNVSNDAEFIKISSATLNSKWLL